MSTPNNQIPFIAENTLDPAAGLNLALDVIDGPLQLSVVALQDDPPSAPIDGDRYIVGVGTGDWAGQDNKIARYIADGDSWSFFTALYCVNQSDESFYGFFAGTWKVLASTTP